MKLEIKLQDSYSRGELLLRTIFGIFYIAIPHFVVMFFVSIWSGIVVFLSGWIVLFTGKYTKSFYEFMVKYLAWSTRLNATIYNLVDGYPAIGVGGTSDKVKLEITQPEKLSRGLLILKVLFGLFYVYIPHSFCLFFRALWGDVLMFLAWWAVIFTGKYPEKWHAYQVGTLRWINRVGIYWPFFMTDEYPPFTGKEVK